MQRAMLGANITDGRGVTVFEIPTTGCHFASGITGDDVPGALILRRDVAAVLELMRLNGTVCDIDQAAKPLHAAEQLLTLKIVNGDAVKEPRHL
jgi:hypothetical protein